MQDINRQTEEFKFKYERYLIGCDALEELGLWNKDVYGEMEAYYQNDLIGVILRVIVSDGIISEKETEYLNKSFGFKYSTSELEDYYNSCRDAFGQPFNTQARAGYLLMRTINEKLAEAYKELLELACTILISSDGIIGQVELEELQRAKESIFSKL